MAVVATDMKWFLSGGGGNTNPNLSLGGQISSTQIVSNALANLFDNVSSSEAAAGDTEYRCAYLKNDNASSTLNSVKLWVQSNTPSSTTTIDIALDPAGITDGVSPAAVSPSPLDENNPPPGVNFALSPLPTTEGTAINIGNLGPQQCIAVWFRRTINAGTIPAPNDPATFRISGVPV